MRNRNTDDDGETYIHDYSPNELSKLSIDNPMLYKEVVESNLEDGDTIERWQQRNLEWAQECLREQRLGRK